MVGHDLVDLECLERMMISSNISKILEEHRLQMCTENHTTIQDSPALGSTVSEKILFTLVISIVILFTAGGNLLTIIAVANGKYLKSLSHMFIASLATADLIVGSVVMPFSMLYTVTFDGVWIFGPVMCDIWQFADYVGCSASLTNLCTIALDRYLTVSRPLQTMRTRTKNKVRIMIFFTWLIPVLHWTIFIAVLRARNGPSTPGKCSFLWEPSVTVLVSVSIIIYIPILVILCLFTMIYCTLRAHVRTLGDKLQARAQRRGSDWASFSRDSESDGNSTGIGEAVHLRTVSVVDGKEAGTEYGRHELDVNTGCWGFLAQSLDKYRDSADTSDNQVFSSVISDADVLYEWSKKQKNARHRPEFTRKKAKSEQHLRTRTVSEDLDDVFVESKTKFPGEQAIYFKQTNMKLTNGHIESVSDNGKGKDPDHLVGELESVNLTQDISKENEIENLIERTPRRRLPDFLELSSKGSDLGSENSIASSKTSKEQSKKGSLARRAIANGFKGERDRLSSFATSESPDSVKNEAAMSVFNFTNTDSSTLESGKKRSSANLAKSRLSRQIRAARMLSIIMTCLLLCWLPFAVMWPLRSFCSDCVTQRLYNFSFWLNYANSAINPILYCLCNPAFRVAFKKLLSRKNTHFGFK